MALRKTSPSDEPHDPLPASDTDEEWQFIERDTIRATPKSTITTKTKPEQDSNPTGGFDNSPEYEEPPMSYPPTWVVEPPSSPAPKLSDLFHWHSRNLGHTVTVGLETIVDLAIDAGVFTYDYAVATYDAFLDGTPVIIARSHLEIASFVLIAPLVLLGICLMGIDAGHNNLGAVSPEGSYMSDAALIAIFLSNWIFLGLVCCLKPDPDDSSRKTAAIGNKAKPVLVDHTYRALPALLISLVLLPIAISFFELGCNTGLQILLAVEAVAWFLQIASTNALAEAERSWARENGVRLAYCSPSGWSLLASFCTFLASLFAAGYFYGLEFSFWVWILPYLPLAFTYSRWIDRIQRKINADSFKSDQIKELKKTPSPPPKPNKVQATGKTQMQTTNDFVATYWPVFLLLTILAAFIIAMLVLEQFEAYEQRITDLQGNLTMWEEMAWTAEAHLQDLEHKYSGMYIENRQLKQDAIKPGFLGNIFRNLMIFFLETFTGVILD